MYVQCTSCVYGAVYSFFTFLQYQLLRFYFESLPVSLFCIYLIQVNSRYILISAAWCFYYNIVNIHIYFLATEGFTLTAGINVHLKLADDLYLTHASLTLSFTTEERSVELKCALSYSNTDLNPDTPLTFYGMFSLLLSFFFFFGSLPTNKNWIQIILKVTSATKQ